MIYLLTSPYHSLPFLGEEDNGAHVNLRAPRAAVSLLYGLPSKHDDLLKISQTALEDILRAEITSSGSGSGSQLGLNGGAGGGLGGAGGIGAGGGGGDEGGDFLLDDGAGDPP